MRVASDSSATRRSCSARRSCAASREVLAAHPEELGHGDDEACPEPDEPAEPEPQGEGDVVEHPGLLVAVLPHAERRSHDVAQEHLGESARDPARIQRGDGRHDVLGGAERVVLVAVLDVGDPFAVKEPRAEVDALLEAGAIEVRALRAGMALEDRAQVVLHSVPVELDVVVAVDDGEGVPLGDEARELGEHVRVPLCDAAQLQARVIGGVAQTMGPFLFVRGGRERGRRSGRHRDGHADEIDEVARDDDAPAASARLLAAVVLEEQDQVAVDRR